MREPQIKQAVNFVKSMQGKNISLDEQKKFLQGKLNEEEIAEVFKRLTKEAETGVATPEPQSGAPVNSIQRIQTIDGHFSSQNRESIATVASVAILSSFALTYLLDKYKTKQDKNLRDELKDRINQNLKESQDKLRQMESAQIKMESTMMTHSQIEHLLERKLKELDENKNIEQVKNKTLNLKIKANRANNLWESASEHDSRSQMTTNNRADSLKPEFDALRLEMVKEIRDMKNGFQSSMKEMAEAMKDCSVQMRDSVQEMKRQRDFDNESGHTNMEVIKCPYTGQSIQKQPKLELDDKIEPTIVDVTTPKNQVEEEKKEEKPPAAELTETQKQELQEFLTKFTDGFQVQSEKDQSVKQLKLVFNMIKNKNASENFKIISIQNEKFKRIKDNNEYFIEFLGDIGFSKTDGQCPNGSDAKYKFVEVSDDENEKSIAKGNIKNLEYILTLL